MEEVEKDENSVFPGKVVMAATASVGNDVQGERIVQGKNNGSKRGRALPLRLGLGRSKKSEEAVRSWSKLGSDMEDEVLKKYQIKNIFGSRCKGICGPV